jgi:ribulose-bisphosphate carboxylase small chain
VCKATVAKRSGFSGLARVPVSKSEFAARTVSNGSKVQQMLVWQPTNNKFFETLSFLPPLTQEQIGKQVDYITRNGWVPCLEFADGSDLAYASNDTCIRLSGTSSNYVDNRYWTMYKLPMFGCTDSSQVLGEVNNCTKSFPDAYIRLIAFDPVRQVQMISFLVHRPPGANDFTSPDKRSI